ncbi:transketolase [candidate division KSB1 bacterium]
MPRINSKTGKVVKEYSIGELEEAANYMRGLNLISLCSAGSGHSGGTLSAMDITAALYLQCTNYDPENPDWEDRDRIIWSTGHKAPNLYIGLGMAGFYDVEDVVTLRKLSSPFQGHPHWLKLKGVEASTGSLGQGLSIAVGIGLAAKLAGKDFRAFSINGDGEMQEGQIWEAAMSASHYKLDNVISIVDVNRLQIDGFVKDVLNIDPLDEKFRSFGWNVIEIDGHNIKEIVEAVAQAKNHKGQPTAILANTVKGKGVDFMENKAGWHGRPPTLDELHESLKQLNLTEKFDLDRLFAKADAYQKKMDKYLDEVVPKFKKNYWWNEDEQMKVDMKPTRLGFGETLKEEGGDERIVCIGLDISGSITISKFLEDHPERKNRWLSMGIAEQNGTCVAAGLAREGLLPVLGTYGTFASARNLDQLRTTVCYGNFNVFVAGAHGGVSVGPDGATHQALEELFQMCGLPNMAVDVPCDIVETKRASTYLLLEHAGPKYLRFAREATPVVTKESDPWVFGKANVIRLRSKNANFIDAFEHTLASEYKNENEDLAIIACGPSVPESMRAAYILKEDYGLETRIVNMHTIKPLDKEAAARAAEETGCVITAEEHQIGGLGFRVSAAICEAQDSSSRPVVFDMIGVKDRFGDSGAPWELVKEFEVAAEHIAKMAKDKHDMK